MSKVIKVDHVLFDSHPVILKSYNKTAEKASKIEKPSIDVEKMLEKNALESAQISISAAVKEVEGIKQRSDVETHFAYLNGYNDGVKIGARDGSNKGKEEGEKTADEKFSSAVSNLLNYIKELDTKKENDINSASADCIDFAFGLAENILGIPVDREKEKYKELEKSLFYKEPKALNIETNGKTYSIKTLQTDAILKSCDGLQGIFAYRRDIEKDSADSGNTHKEIEEEAENIEIDLPLGEVKEEQGEISKVEEQIPLKGETQKNDEVEDTEKVTVRPFEPQDFSKIEEPEMPEPEVKKEAKPFVFEDFGKNQNKAEEPALFPTEKEDAASSEPDDSGLNDQQDEKFVFLNPKAKKSKLMSQGDELSIEDIAKFSKEDLKAVLKKFEPKDIAAALQDESKETINSFLDALTPKTKQKVSEAIKYLGPYSDDDVKSARELIIKAANTQ